MTARGAESSSLDRASIPYPGPLPANHGKHQHANSKRRRNHRPGVVLELPPPIRCRFDLVLQLSQIRLQILTVASMKENVEWAKQQIR
jgi:hypothetical protein